MKRNYKILCPVCTRDEAQIDKRIGILPCKICTIRQNRIDKPNKVIEFTSHNIKEERKKYFKSTIQKYREGQLSREFIEAYPERAKAMVKEGIHTEKEIKQAKDVWSDISGVNWRRSK